MPVRTCLILFVAAMMLPPALCYAEDESSSRPDGLTPSAEEGSSQTPQQAAPAEKPDKDKAKKTEGEKGEEPGGDFFGRWGLFIILIGGFLLLYLFMGRSRRRQEHQRKEMLANLKKGDKVTSIGGIVGTVIEIREDEVTVKVDETNNVRMKFARWAIRGVGQESKVETPGQKR